MWRTADARPRRWRDRAALLLLIMLASASAPAEDLSAPTQALVINIEGAIGPAIADHVVQELADADRSKTGLVILRLDTPGGLDIAMRKIIKAELASPVAVVAYVAPSGARAASAGTYIVYAASVAAMAPGTNLGAATPVLIGGLPELPDGAPKPPDVKPGTNKEDGKGDGEPAAPADGADAMSRKMVNDAVGYIRSLAQLHGRNADWAESAVRGAASLPAEEALKRHVIDLIAATLPDLLQAVDGRKVIVDGQPQVLSTAHLDLVEAELDWRTRLLIVITDPNVAYLLMLIGMYGLIFELANPGSVLPGVIGGICLLLALFAFSVLPIDYAGVALVLLGIALMVAEAFVGSFGVLGIGGITAFVFGSVIMFKPGSPSFELSISVVIASSIATAGLLILVLAMLVRSRRKAIVTGKEALIGTAGEVVEWSNGGGRVRILGELWRARAAEPLRPGERIKVRDRDGLQLVVERHAFDHDG